jgi:hypothetical protein
MIIVNTIYLSILDFIAVQYELSTGTKFDFMTDYNQAITETGKFEKKILKRIPNDDDSENENNNLQLDAGVYFEFDFDKKLKPPASSSKQPPEKKKKKKEQEEESKIALKKRKSSETILGNKIYSTDNFNNLNNNPSMNSFYGLSNLGNNMVNNLSNPPIIMSNIPKEEFESSPKNSITGLRSHISNTNSINPPLNINPGNFPKINRPSEPTQPGTSMDPFSHEAFDNIIKEFLNISDFPTEPKDKVGLLKKFISIYKKIKDDRVKLYNFLKKISDKLNEPYEEIKVIFLLILLGIV